MVSVTCSNYLWGCARLCSAQQHMFYDTVLNDDDAEVHAFSMPRVISMPPNPSACHGLGSTVEWQLMKSVEVGGVRFNIRFTNNSTITHPVAGIGMDLLTVWRTFRISLTIVKHRVFHQVTANHLCIYLMVQHPSKFKTNMRCFHFS